MCGHHVTGWAGDAENCCSPRGALNSRADPHSREEWWRDGSFIPILKFKERWMAMERPLTDMKNLFLKIKFLNQYVTSVLLLLGKATHTHTHTHTQTKWFMDLEPQERDTVNLNDTIHQSMRRVYNGHKRRDNSGPSFFPAFLGSFHHSGSDWQMRLCPSNLCNTRLEFPPL